MALRSGRQEAHLAYTRFVILGRPRTGSNFLQWNLNAHPAVVAYGELFGGQDEVVCRELEWNRWRWLPPRRSRSVTSLLRNDPVAFLEREAYVPVPVFVLAVGFKLMYHHAREGALRRVWPWLKECEGLKIIHLRRANVLRAHLSLCRAQVTGRWIDFDGSGVDEGPLHLDPQECREAFEMTRAWETEAEDHLQGCDLLDVLYEDLVNDFDSEMRRIQSFLGVEARKLKPRTHKQATASLREAIANYDELSQEFANTQWQQFFED